MTHVLLAVDDDNERAERQAERVASLDWDSDAIRATVLHVFTENIEGATIGRFGPARKARDTLEDAGIDIELAESSGEPGVEIVEFAKEVDADLISVAGRNRTPAGKAVFGSVAQTVMLDSELPVLFSGSGGQ
ncbi:MAG: nucleotide-binding universal stress UspA family protein [Natronomonas sp.]|jgi:nucleotide-binding universal stress UspA family protein|uniref:universal stress protein n=1 Tax=Natronomonas sp. TaxID=2184060 RepID=UPI0039895208